MLAGPSTTATELANSAALSKLSNKLRPVPAALLSRAAAGKARRVVGYNPPLLPSPIMLEANEISCIRGNRDLFRHLSFRVEGGNTLRIHGANGAGKTSLLRMIVGLSPVLQGHISWCGQPLGKLGDDFARHLVFVGHANALKAYLSPFENLKLNLAIQGVAANDGAVRAALEEEGLASVADAPLQWLSAGQQRRVALMRTRFAASRKLWVLDEPFSSLDDDAIRRVSLRLAKHVADGNVVVYTTHQNVTIDAPTKLLELA